jgi:hypothetical protein
LLHELDVRIKEEDATKASDPQFYLKDIHVTNNSGARISIASGGFPVNFDRTAHSVDPADIWPTRALLMLSFLLAENLKRLFPELVGSLRGNYMIPAEIQYEVMRTYALLNPTWESALAASLRSPDEREACLCHIAKNSEGLELPEEMRSKLFAHLDSAARMRVAQEMALCGPEFPTGTDDFTGVQQTVDGVKKLAGAQMRLFKDETHAVLDNLAALSARDAQGNVATVGMCRKYSS